MDSGCVLVSIFEQRPGRAKSSAVCGDLDILEVEGTMVLQRVFGDRCGYRGQGLSKSFFSDIN